MFVNFFRLHFLSESGGWFKKILPLFVCPQAWAFYAEHVTLNG